MVSLSDGVGKAFGSNVVPSKMMRGRVMGRRGSGRVVGNVGGFVLVGSRLKNFSGVLIRKLEEVVEEAGISRINKRGFPVVI